MTVLIKTKGMIKKTNVKATEFDPRARRRRQSLGGQHW